MATKTDMEKELKSLREEIRNYRKNNKLFEENLENLKDIGYGVKMDDNQYKLIKINYNSETKNAIVSDIIEIGKSLAMTINRGKKEIIDLVLNAKKEGNK